MFFFLFFFCSFADLETKFKLKPHLDYIQTAAGDELV